jgi:hypothetical protein
MGGERRVERPVAAVPAAQDVRQPTARRSWREKVRHAVDLTIAFVLLEDDPGEPARPAAASSDTHGRTADPGPASMPGPATATSTRWSVDDRHPHRVPLRPMPRPRRPGAAAPRPQICISPVREPAAAPKRRERTV